jgi:hypothetical protein
MNNKLLFESLVKYYNENKKSADILVSIINNKTNISLRSIDWFITNYSKKSNIYYNIYKGDNGDLIFDKNELNKNELKNYKVVNINVFQSYKSQLRAYSKKKFDPFCRRDRLIFEINNEKIETTVGQLNFFRWAINNMVIDYIINNKDKIEEDMNCSLKKIKQGGGLHKKIGDRKKRQELSLSATRGLSRTNINILITFD